MHRVKKIIREYNRRSDVFLLDYLLFSDNILQTLEEVSILITTSRFLENLKSMLLVLKNEYNYPKKQMETVKIILNYVKYNNKNLEKEVDECYQILSEIKDYSNDKYLDEFEMKKNRFVDFKENEYYIWKKDDLEESICFDYIVYISLSVSSNIYCSFYMPKFILSKNYLYAIKKIMSLCPDIFNILEFNERIKEILKLNLEMLENYDEETIKKYIEQNYHIDQITKFNIKELDEFKEDILNVYEKLENKNYVSFDFDEFRSYYQLLTLRQKIYLNKDIDINNIEINIITLFIEESYSNLNDSQRKLVINILKTRKDELTEEEYNYYLDLLQNKKLSIKNILKKEDLSLKYDLENFQLFMASHEELEHKKEHIQKTKYPLSILKYIDEYYSMFQDETIYNRTREILDICDDKTSKKAIKKLEKITKGL